MDTDKISEKLGITMSQMQRAAAAAIIQGSGNVEVLSPTGSGKTLAYLLPLAQLIDAKSDELQAVVIVPGRELAIQSAEVLASLKAGVRGYACHGGRSAMDEHRELRKLMPHVVFATPGRLNDHLDKANIDPSGVRWTVIDEFDKCLQMGFADEMNHAMERMPKTARRIFLSATNMADDGRANGELSPVGFHIVDFLENSDDYKDRVKINIVNSPDKDKLRTLVNLLACLGGLDQSQREEAIYRFANGSANILISTNLGSRGLDIPNVRNIVHYHLPETEEDYTHRVGRTARWDKTGETYFILSEGETLPDYVDATICDFEFPENLPAPAKSRMTTLYIGKGKKDKVSKGDILGFLCKTGGLKGAEIGRIDVYDYYAYAAVDNRKLNFVLKNVQGCKIKGKRTKVEEMR